MVLQGGPKAFPIYQDILDRVEVLEKRLSAVESWIKEHVQEIEEDRSFRKNNIRSKEEMMNMLAELQKIYTNPSDSDMTIMQLTEIMHQKLITASKETIAQEKERLEQERKKKEAKAKGGLQRPL